MPARNAKGRFVKSGARKSGGGAMVRTRTVVQTRYRTRNAPKRKGRRRGRGRMGGGINIAHLAIAGAAIGYATSANGPEFVRTNAAKIPGAKTFGTDAALGVACLAIDRFVKPNKWLRYAGYAGVAMAALKFGSQGKNFKWVGDDGGAYDLADVDDVAGYDDDVSDVGDDDDI